MELFTIDRAGAGTLSTAAMPASYDDLAALAAAGVDRVVCLLGEAEAGGLGLAAEAETAGEAGLVFHRFPIADFGVPDENDVRALVAEISSALAAGERVVVHCRGGIGRSSLVAAAVLVAEGATADEAWSRISTARGFPVPETDEQRAFVGRLVEN